MKKTILILIAIILGGSVATIGFFKFSNIPLWKEESTITTPEETIPEEITPQYVELEVNAYETSYSWSRDDDTDLPLYSSNVKYMVENQGTETASNIDVTVSIDGKAFKSHVISFLNPQSEYRNDFSLTIQYDHSKSIKVEAEIPTSSDRYTFTISAKLPRYMPLGIAKLYVTPKDGIIQQKVKDIVVNPLIPDWIEIREWVANNVEYTEDSTIWNQNDYWLLPRETIFKGKGDCEDFAILTTSLLRATGYDTNEVYVITGYKNKNGERVGHAWVKVHLDILGWYFMEPQEGIWGIFGLEHFSLQDYDLDFEFNDGKSTEY